MSASYLVQRVTQKRFLWRGSENTKSACTRPHRTRSRSRCSSSTCSTTTQNSSSTVGHVIPLQKEQPRSKNSYSRAGRSRAGRTSTLSTHQLNRVGHERGPAEGRAPTRGLDRLAKGHGHSSERRRTAPSWE